jgi:hypothetical protein
MLFCYQHDFKQIHDFDISLVPTHPATRRSFCPRTKDCCHTVPHAEKLFFKDPFYFKNYEVKSIVTKQNKKFIGYNANENYTIQMKNFRIQNENIDLQMDTYAIQLKLNIYICNCFHLHNTVTSKCIYHLIDAFATSQYRSTWRQRVKLQHFVPFFTFVLKSGMIIDYKYKYK